MSDDVCPEMTAREFDAQGWAHRGDVLFKSDGEAVVFFADIVNAHEPTRMWVESRMRRPVSLDEFEMED